MYLPSVPTPAYPLSLHENELKPPGVDIRVSYLFYSFALFHVCFDCCLRRFLSMCSKVESKYVLDLDDADIALLPKGDKVEGEG